MRYLLITICMFCLCMNPICALALTPADIIIVYNINSKASEEVAKHYSKQRSVPDTNFVFVDVPISESISYPQYQSQLVPPVRTKVNELITNGNKPVILLIYGIPLRINNPGIDKDEEESLIKLTNSKIQEYEHLILTLSAEIGEITGFKLAKETIQKHLKEKLETKEILEVYQKTFQNGIDWVKSSQGNQDEEARRSPIFNPSPFPISFSLS